MTSRRLVDPNRPPSALAVDPRLPDNPRLPDDPRLADDSRLAVTITWVAAAIALVVALAGPLGYYLLSSQGQHREALVAARLHAAFITQVIQGSGEDWRQEVSGLIDADLAPSELPEHRSIVDVTGRQVAGSGPQVAEPMVTTTAPLLGREGPVGEVRIARSMQPIMLNTSLIALLSAALGAAIFLSLKVLPLRALNRTLQALRRNEARARQQAEDNLRLVFEHSVEGIVILTPAGQVLSCNPAAAAMFGYASSELADIGLDALVAPQRDATGANAFPVAQFETTGRHRSGQQFPVELTVSASGMRDSSHRIAVIRDITERKQAEERLSKMANYDGLTGLPNRSQFRERLHRSMAFSQRNGHKMALMFLDIDRFKSINDSLGHEFGDRLLIQVAARLAHCIRQSDAPGRQSDAIGRRADVADPQTDTQIESDVFRLGGDEFTVLLDRLTTADTAAAVARRILHTLAQPFVLGEHELFISASIGITIHPDGETDPDALIRQADMAMYRSKEVGRDTYSFYSAELDAIASERHLLETSLRHAFERGEFHLVYQPKADLHTGEITGVEALLRLERPGQPEVGPEKFIPILEETGLIVQVGGWVIQQACRQLVQWDGQLRASGLPPLNLAVNLSARQFRQQDLIGQIAAALSDVGLAPQRLEIELTESTLIEDSEAVTRIMASLGELGVAVAIDDFGTGHSSLSYLKRFDVDTLKIDRSFVRDTPDDPEDNAIAIAVIALAHGLGLKVVAEGVENQRQAEFLRAQNCDQIQGYLLSPPLAPDALVAWIRARHTGAAVTVAATAAVSATAAATTAEAMPASKPRLPHAADGALLA